MTTVPPLSDNIREFLGTIEAALDYADLNLGVNFGHAHPEAALRSSVPSLCSRARA